MKILKPSPGIKGLPLKEEINAQEIERTPLIEGLIYEHSVVMCSGDPGTGKSVLIANIIACASSGLPLFGSLNVLKPFKVYYIPFERGRDEIYERLKCISETIPLNYDYITVNDSFIGYNVIDFDCATAIIERIKQDDFDYKLIILDPIYSSVAGGLSTDEKASQFCRFSARLQKEIGCSIWMNHHNVKDSYDKQGEKINKSDPFYGSIWLKAHATAAYTLQLRDDNKHSTGIKLTNKKDSYGVLIKKIELDYNAENYTLFFDNKNDGMTTLDKVKIFLRNKWNKDMKSFYFAELEGCDTMGVTRNLRRVMSHLENDGCISKFKTNGKSTLYRLIKNV